LKREEATVLLREISACCDVLGHQGIVLVSPKAENPLLNGYQLQIKSKITGEDFRCLKAIVERRGLAVANEPEKNLLVIYKPVKKPEVVPV